MRIYLSRPHMSGFEQGFVSDAFESNFIAPLGPQLDAFEESVRQYLGGDFHCVALSSGTAALHLALRIAGVAPGDEVWVSSMTFAGGAFPTNYLGAKPRFFDIDQSGWTLNADLVEDVLSKANKDGTLPKAIVPTDLYGQSSDIERLEKIAGQYDIPLIVDSAESLGSSVGGGRKAGTGGDAAILSFNGNKIITSSGGGMLVTRHKDWADEARFLASQARDPAPHYEHSVCGYNYRLSNVCAAIGLGQMSVLDERVTQRRAVFKRYEAHLARPGVQFMPEPLGFHSSRWLTALTIDPAQTGTSREEVRLELLRHDIECRPLWKPMHMQPLYKGAGYVGGGFDEKLFVNGICLPSGSDLSNTEQDEVIDRILRLFGSTR